MKQLRRIGSALPLLAMVVATVMWTGCGSNPPVPEGPGGYSDLAQAGNIITVQFTEPGMPGTWEQTIGQNGMISLPLGRSVQAAGKSTSELEKAIHDIYVPELYRRMTVVVNLENRFYWVKGEVRNPGQLKYLGSTTILNAITAAGDYTDFADRGHVRLVRDGKTYRVDNSDFETPIYPGDTVIVDRRL